MTVANERSNSNIGGTGIHMSNAKVELFNVALKGCFGSGFLVHATSFETNIVATRCEFANNRSGAVVSGSLTSAKFNNCVFRDNSDYGIHGNQSTIHLHGEATAIHSNGRYGIYADISGKVIIHLPSHHNTSYNNGGEDRLAGMGGTITNVED